MGKLRSGYLLGIFWRPSPVCALASWVLETGINLDG